MQVAPSPLLAGPSAAAAGGVSAAPAHLSSAPPPGAFSSMPLPGLSTGGPAQLGLDGRSMSPAGLSTLPPELPACLQGPPLVRHTRGVLRGILGLTDNLS